MGERDEEDIIHDLFQRTWIELLKLREQDKLRNFDIIVPAQLLQWIEDIYKKQLETYEIADKDMYQRKKFNIAVNFRLTIENILGMDYFMKEMSNQEKMGALDKFIDSLYDKIRDDNKIKNDLR